MFVNPMIRIQMNELDGQLILQVEGRLAGAFELELLKDCWQGAYSKHPDRKISVDLKSVTCIDQAGRRLLQSMHGNGVGFIGAGLATQDILEQVMERRTAGKGVGDCK
jgi:anti-anti-sigma regulatory factor